MVSGSKSEPARAAGTARRAALPLVIAFFVAGLAILFATDALLTASVDRQHRQAIESNYRMLVQQQRLMGPASAISALAYRHQQVALAGDPSYYMIRRRDGRTVVANGTFWPKDRVANEWMRFRDPADGSTVLARIYPLGTEFELLLGERLTVLDTVQRVLLPVSLGALLILFVIALWFVRRAERAAAAKCDEISATLERARAGDMTVRIAVAPGARDEFDRMADEINLLLRHVQDLVHGLSNLAANIAHELAGPMARLVERANAIDNASPSAGDDLDDLAMRLAGLGDLFQSLLEIYQIEAGAEMPLGEVASDAVVREAVDLNIDFAEERGVHIAIDVVPVRIRAHYWQLGRIIGNLVENAIRFTPEGGKVEILGGFERKAYVLTVRDHGPGIGGLDLDGLMARLRMGKWNDRNTEFGLGLRIVRAIAIRHGILFRLHDRGDGLDARLTFPAAMLCSD